MRHWVASKRCTRSIADLFQERGHCYVALRSAEAAIEAFLRAVNLNPALPASWNALQALFRMTGQATNAKMAADHVDYPRGTAGRGRHCDEHVR